MEKANGFKNHGVIFRGEAGNQIYGDCPFCGKSNKFYVNAQNFLWDCKKCGKKGNFTSFLSFISKQNQNDMDKNALNKMSRDRKLPTSAFPKWEMGKSDNGFTFPIRNEKGFIQDLRRYKLGQNILGTAGCSSGLLGLHHLVKASKSSPVYLCEGEWDGIAMSWLLDYLKEKAVVVAVPGANTFKREWVSFFKGYEVYTLYDKDEPGENGEITAKERLTGIAKEIYYTHWSLKLPTGYDVRDLITRKAVIQKKPRRALQIIKSMFQTFPRKSIPVRLSDSEESQESTKKFTKTSLEEVYTLFKKWLYLKNTHAIEISLASIITNHLQGDPIWMFIVSPPGGSKTEVLNSFSKCQNVYITSSLTPHSLISGASWKQKEDTSLIPQLDGRTLIIKDFTSILGKRETEREEIFSVLRDAYDGTCGKVFGNGVVRKYKSHFSILSGVTPSIYEIAIQHQSLGERFLKFTIGENLEHTSEESIINRAINNLNRENQMRKELSEVVAGFVHHQIANLDFKNLPTIPSEILTKLISLAQFGARMRGSISRNRYHPDMITSKPSAEVGSRLGKQLAKISIGLAIVNGHKKITEHEYTLCKKIMLDTISQRHEDLIRIMFKELPTIDDTLKTREVSFKSRYTQSTVSRMLADMNMLGIVDRVGKSNAYEWTVSKYMRSLIEKSGLYTSKDELPEKTVVKKLKVKRRK